MTVSTPPVVDIAALTAPISADQPAGVHLREDFSPESLYYALKGAAREARATERKRDEGEPVEPDWGPICALGQQALESSKDMEVCCWVIEGLCREAGFAGLRDGFDLATKLVEGFFDHLHPRPDEDEGPTACVAPLIGLNGEEGPGVLISPIARVPLVWGDEEGLASWQYQAARDGKGSVTLESFELAVQASRPEDLRQNAADIEGALESLATLGRALQGKCGTDAPPISKIRGALEEAQEFLGYLMTSLPAEAEVMPDDGAAPAANGEAPAPPPPPPGEIRSRADAFDALKKVATFFRKTEPHSPLSYTLERVVGWGSMTLPQLLAELIPDDTARRNFEKVTGVIKPED